MSNDPDPTPCQPRIRARLLGVPVSVEQSGHASGRSGLQGGTDEVAGAIFETAVDQQRSIGALERDYVGASAGQEDEVLGERCRRDGRLGVSAPGGGEHRAAHGDTYGGSEC